MNGIPLDCHDYRINPIRRGKQTQQVFLIHTERIGTAIEKQKQRGRAALVFHIGVEDERFGNVLISVKKPLVMRVFSNPIEVINGTALRIESAVRNSRYHLTERKKQTGVEDNRLMVPPLRREGNETIGNRQCDGKQ